MKRKTIEELEKEIQELRAEISAMKASPEIHYHTHLPPFIQQLNPFPQPQWPSYPQITFGNTCGQSDTNRSQLLC